MAIKMVYLMVCDECKCLGPSWSGARDKASYAQKTRRAAQREGWRRMPSGEQHVDLCPACAASRRRNSHGQPA